MDYKNKIIRYLDNQMSEKEKLSFEEEVKNSSVLRKELGICRKFLNEINQIKNIETGSEYFNNIIPDFHSGIEKNKAKGWIPKLSYGLIAILIISFSVFYLLKESGQQNFITNERLISGEIYDPFIEEFTISDLTSEIDKNYDSLMNAVIFNELELNTLDIDNILADGNLDYLTPTENPNQEEADIIYYQVLNKKFF